jgi:hypothetical protein
MEPEDEFDIIQSPSPATQKQIMTLINKTEFLKEWSPRHKEVTDAKHQDFLRRLEATLIRLNDALHKARLDGTQEALDFQMPDDAMDVRQAVEQDLEAAGYSYQTVRQVGKCREITYRIRW